MTTFGRNNHAIRSDRWRYIRYADGGEELYDHSNDPYEWVNLAERPEHAALKQELAKWFPTTNAETVKRPADAKGAVKTPRKNRRNKQTPPV